MPFPSAKANLMEYGSHVPLAIDWPARIEKGGVCNDLVSLIDLAPTFLQIAGISQGPRDGQAPAMTGKSLADLLFGKNTNGQAQPHRDYVLTGRERHSHSRPDDLGYPSRAIRTDNYLFILNDKPDRWPAGDPPPGNSSTDGKSRGRVGPEGNGADFKPIGIGYGDIDDPSPTKTFMMQHKNDWPLLFREGFEKRQKEQLFDIKKDPGCTHDLIADPGYAAIGRMLKDSLLQLLVRQGDPRALGKGDIFDSYPRFGLMRNWPGFKERGKYNPAMTPPKD
jgi:uncharacterized sulfatase